MLRFEISLFVSRAKNLNIGGTSIMIRCEKRNMMTFVEKKIINDELLRMKKCMNIVDSNTPHSCN